MAFIMNFTSFVIAIKVNINYKSFVAWFIVRCHLNL